MGKIIGIDLGTTNSVVAVMEAGKATVIVNAEGSRITPSVVAFTGEERLVGQAAKRQAVTNPKNTVFSIKRFMGRRHNEVDAEEKLVPYDIVGESDELVKVGIEKENKQFTPPEISAMILQKLKQTAEDYLGEKVTDAVITVPAYFNDSQRQATKDAGTIAGLDVKRIINEPTAASLAYGLDKKQDEKIAVFDLGGGTFDISILEVWEEGGLRVLATNGDTHLGGDDFDYVLINYIAEDFKKDNMVDLRQDAMALQRLKEGAEKAKCELSSSQQTEVNLPFITADQTGPKHLQMTITRAKLEQLTEHLIDRARGPVQRALSDAKLNPSDIGEIVLVGGMTRMPAVQNLVKDLFGKDPHKGVNPDEVVAVGAAIQGGILAGEAGEVVLLDVTPLSLGIETLGGVMTCLVERNTTIPHTKKETFSTAADNQTAVDIHVLQGERDMALDNRTLGRFQLVGIPPAPRGMPQIEVTFDIDANGILSVSAKDLGTGKEQAIRIESSSGLSKEEVEKMRKDAEQHADEDKKKRELIEERNKADQLVWSTEKTVKEHGDKLNADEKEKITKALEKVKEVAKGDDKEAISKACEELMQSAHRIAEIMYQEAAKAQAASGQAGPQAGPSGKGPSPADGEQTQTKKDEDVIDADFEVMDDDKKE